MDAKTGRGTTKVPKDIVPLGILPSTVLHATLQFPHHHKRQKTTKNMTPDGLVSLSLAQRDTPPI